MKKFLIAIAATLAVAGCKREGPSEENSVNIVADNAYENMMPDESMVPPVENSAVDVANIAEAAVASALDRRATADARGCRRHRHDRANRP